MKRAIVGEDDTLQYRVVALAFDRLPLHKKRELLPELLRSAKVIHGVFMSPVEDKFCSWLTRGQIKQFTEEETEKLWSLWCYIKKTSTSASISDTDDPKIKYNIIYQDDYDLEKEDTFYIGNKQYVKKEEYFEWLMANTYPDIVKLGADDLGCFYSFPNLKCDEDNCCCDISPLALENNHYWLETPYH